MAQYSVRALRGISHQSKHYCGDQPCRACVLSDGSLWVLVSQPLAVHLAAWSGGRSRPSASDVRARRQVAAMTCCGDGTTRSRARCRSSCFTTRWCSCRQRRVLQKASFKKRGLGNYLKYTFVIENKAKLSDLIILFIRLSWLGCLYYPVTVTTDTRRVATGSAPWQ